MNKSIIVEKRYINIPVKNGSEQTHGIVRDKSAGKILRYFDVAIGDGDCDFIAYHDMKEFIGRELYIEIEDKDKADLLVRVLKQSDTPMGLENVYQEKHRPQFHFSSKRGWLNDPNGLFFYEGKYHMFYQHNPFGINWGNMHWGHAVSDDLVHWQEKGDVLCPDELGMMFSGGAVVDLNNTSGLQQGEHSPIFLFYTAAGSLAPEPCEATQCAAYSLDGGETFTKYVNNPVVGFTAKDARDPSVIWHEKSSQWIMTLYLGDEKRTFKFFKSKNLLNWEPAAQDEFKIPGGRECPEFFPVPVNGDVDNLKWICMEANGKYLIGEFDGERFEPEAGPFECFTRRGYGCNYACQSWSNVNDGRRILIGWQMGWQIGTCASSTFTQSMTVPVEFTLKSFYDGLRLSVEPVEELKKLRGKCWEFANVSSDLGTPEELLGIPKGNAWDIELEMGDSCDMHLNICGTDIAFDAEAREVRIGGAKMLFPNQIQDLKVRILVDRASIEIFGGEGRIWHSKWVLTEAEHPVLFPHCAWGSGSLKSLKIYKMNSIWS
jgi:sucrose-6-phosphate hydrolase SacC (GH32 family)